MGWYLSFIILVGGVSALLTRCYLFLAQTLGILDFPSHRSAHTVPTPRGGGIAIVLTFTLAAALLYGWGRPHGTAYWWVIAGGGAIAAVGFIDDLGHVPIPVRLLVHGLMALLLVWFLVPDVGSPFVVLSAAALVWAVNLYNFMDGIDGLAATEAVTVCVGAAGILGWRGEIHAALGLLALAAICAGFLFWNWPPARIFMGDVGSGYLGFVLAALALLTSRTQAIALWSWLILAAVFITDATVTLMRRILRGERWWKAHATHAYQHLARRYGHRMVTLGVGLINLIWLLPLAWTAARFPRLSWMSALVAYLPLVLMAFRFRAGMPSLEGRDLIGDNS